MMEWFIVGLENAAVETVTESWRTVLTLDPDNDALDGTMFACRATLTDGREVEENITLAVEGIIKVPGCSHCNHESCFSFTYSH